MNIQPIEIRGPWNSCYILDKHTIDSQYVGVNEYGHSVFDTRRTETGELLYQFKYRGSKEALRKLVDIAVEFWKEIKNNFDLIVPIPPSKTGRTTNEMIVRELATIMNISMSANALIKIKDTPQIKDVDGLDEREAILRNAFAADIKQLEGKTILLVDDIYRSGATMTAATKIILEQGKAADVYAFAFTYTRYFR